MKRFTYLIALFILFCLSGQSQSVEQLKEQLQQAKTNNDVNAEVETTMKLASMCDKQGDYNQAIAYYKLSIVIFDTYKQLENTATAWGTIAKIYSKQSNTTEALNAYKKATDLFLALHNNKNAAYTLSNTADLYLKLNQKETAVTTYKKALKLYEETTDYKGIIALLTKLGAISSQYGNYPEALSYYDRAYDIATKNKLNQELAIIVKNKEVLKNNQSKLTSTKTDYDKKQENIKEQTINLLTTQNIKSLEEIEQLSIEAQVKELKIKAQQEQLLLKQLEADKQRQANEFLMKEKEYERIKAADKIFKQQMIIIGTSLLAILLFIISLIIYKYYSDKKRANILLEEKNREIIEQAEEIKAQAVEIARYQSQMNPHFIFNAINGFQNSILEGNKEDALKQIQSFAKLLRHTLNNSESEYIKLNDEIAYLNKYIEFELYRFAKKFKFTITLDNTILQETKIPTMLIQPLLENAIKHAGLNSIDNGEIIVSITKNKLFPNQVLTISVTDNGFGIKETGSKKEHISKGTSITKHRIHLEFQKTTIVLQNYFRIESPVDSTLLNKGTVSIIEVPFNI